MKRLTAIVFLNLVVLIGACTTVITPEAEKVKVTRKADDVKGCQELEFFTTSPSYLTKGQWLGELKTRTALAGGDTFLLTSTLRPQGVAYKVLPVIRHLRESDTCLRLKQ